MIKNASMRSLHPAAALASVLSLASCSGDGGATKPGPGPDLYVAGRDGLNATLWKNGSAKSIGTDRAHLMSVHVSGGDVYLAGTDEDPSDYRDKAVVWKNGAAARLSGERSEASSVFASGGGVYVAGAELTDGVQYATLWVNGSPRRLADGLTPPWGYAASVFVSGGDVYVAGSEYDYGTNAYTALLWKNGEAARLGENAVANSVFVSGGDVYVAGEALFGGIISCAAVWKNGDAMVIGDAQVQSSAKSIFVSGGDVYAAGWEFHGSGYNALLWKNGGAARLEGYDASAHSLFVSGGDVYVAGLSVIRDSTRPTVWVNGSAARYALNPAGGGGSASSVFVESAE